MHDPNHHPHGADEIDPRAGGPGAADPAGRSLTDALRVSFRLLTGIMLIVLVGWLASGIATIDPQEKGVKRVFGRLEGVVDKGLAYTWPFPIGAIEEVPTRDREIKINDFWFYERPEEKTIPLEQRRASGEGLRPGWDGALLTGDRYLLHVRLACSYTVSAPIRFKTSLVDPEAVIRSVLCGAAIHAAATETAEGMMSGRIQAFQRNVRVEAQKQLDRLDSGVVIKSVTPESVTWPLGAMSAYRQAGAAGNERERRIKAAEAEAQELLTRAAGGESCLMLVGTLEQVIAGSRQGSREGANYIGRYLQAREDLSKASDELGSTRKAGDKGQEKLLSAKVAELTGQAEALLAEIDKVLVSNQTGGEARGIVSQAAGYSAGTQERLKGWHDNFVRLLPECSTPDSMAFHFERQWRDQFDSILESPLIEKHVLPAGQTTTVLFINADPGIRKRILAETLNQAEQEKQKEASGGSPPAGPPPRAAAPGS